MFKYTKSIEVTPPEKQTYENGTNFFSPLGQYSVKSQKRKAPASVESRMGGRNKKCDILGCWPEDTGKLTSQQGETSQMAWIFTNTAVRISPPPTVVPKRRQETINRRCVKSLQKVHISFTPRSKPKIMQLWKCCIFCSQHAKRMHRLRLAGCFLCCVVHVYAGHFRYKKIIPQQVKGKKK